MKFALLLCSYNVEKRRAMYHDVIRWWMKNSSFHIYIVDSSDNLFDEDVEKACKTHHFNQADHTSCTRDSTTLELLSLDQALSIFGQEWETTYDYIIKLTCKYTLPDLEKQCNLVKNKDNILILQNRGNQNTELMIIRSNKFKEITEESKKLKSILENRIRNIRTKYKHTKLPRLKNLSKYKRAAGDYLPEL